MKPVFTERKPASNTQIRNYFDVLKADPRSRVFAPLAEALIRRGRLQDADQICRLGLEANPDFADGHLAYARVLFFLFRYMEALREVKLTLALDPKCADAYAIAADVFLARSQHQPAVEACLRALDLDPDNGDARRILDRLSAEGHAGGAARAPAAKMGATGIRAVAATSPGRRLVDSKPPGLTDPFKQLIEEVGRAAESRLADSDQPFSAPGDDDLDVPTKREVRASRPAPSPTPIPALPPRPARPPTPTPTPEDLLAEIPVAEVRQAAEAPPEPESVAATLAPAPAVPTPLAVSGAMPGNALALSLPTIRAVQDVIDAYRDRQPAMTEDDGPIRLPGTNRLLVLLMLLLVVAAVGALIAVGLRAEAKRQSDRAGEAGRLLDGGGPGVTGVSSAPVPPPIPAEDGGVSAIEGEHDGLAGPAVDAGADEDADAGVGEAPDAGLAGPGDGDARDGADRDTRKPPPKKRSPKKPKKPPRKGSR
ncbi:MAG: tetratricopeptide repeat protein [Myxococcales bacterium]|nr:tetratricopeptide repeat protein [Myxococcales bacterium]